MDKRTLMDVLMPLATVADAYSGGADDETLVYVHLGRLRNARDLYKALLLADERAPVLDAFGSGFRYQRGTE